MLGPMMGELKAKTADALAHHHAAVRVHHQAPLRPHQVTDGLMSPECDRDRIVVSLNELHSLSRRGLWGILLFLTLSAATLYCNEAGLFTLLPESVREIFGESPPANLLHIVLAVSWLSALVLILGRVTGDGRPCNSWHNIMLPTAFYPLYVFCDPAGTHFPAVFAAGLILLLVEHVSVLCYASKSIREETERLNHLTN